MWLSGCGYNLWSSWTFISVYAGVSVCVFVGRKCGAVDGVSMYGGVSACVFVGQNVMRMVRIVVRW